jgi:hypothetical protein
MKYEVEPSWTRYPCEWKRPRFAYVPHNVDWRKLIELRQQRSQNRVAEKTAAAAAGEASASGDLPPSMPNEIPST